MLLDIYTRISRDGEGSGLGVARQEKDCRAHIERLGHTVGAVLVDNSISAYRRKLRPGYDTLLERVRGGSSEGFVVWHLDRLTRNPREMEDVIDAVEAAGATVLSVTGGQYDLSTSDGRYVARILGSGARKESEDKSRRTKRKHLELAESGRPVGGSRHFGYEPLLVEGVPVLLDHEGYPTLKVRESEAALIREAADAVLAGRSVRSLVKEWNDRGITSTRGKRIQAGTLQRILRSPTIAGWRALDKVPVAEGRWEAIVPFETWRKMVDVLDARRAGQAAGFRGVKPRTYLLSGLLRCGREDCGCRMVSQAHGRGVNHNRTRSYTCPSDPSKDGCGGVRIVAPQTEDEVVQRVLSVIDQAIPEVPADDPTRALVAERDSIEERLAELASDYYVHRRLAPNQFHKANAALTDQLATVKARLAASATWEVVRSAVRTRAELEAAWPGMDLEQRRAVIEQFVDHIVIHPATKPRGTFDPDRVEIRWL